jgi:high-affinity K+ transport system ATPase subunit B
MALMKRAGTGRRSRFCYDGPQPGLSIRRSGDVLFVLTMNRLLGRPMIDSPLFAVALAVGLSPELLPAIISVTLAAGARTMAKQGVIVRCLDAIENLGGTDILCTDKIGTHNVILKSCNRSAQWDECKLPGQHHD